MKFYNFKLSECYYRRDQNAKDPYLCGLKNIFDNGTAWAISVKKALIDPNRTGLTGNKSEVEIEGDLIKIYPQFIDNPEEYAISIDRTILLNLIDRWLELVERDTPEIYLIRHDDGSIDVTDHLPF